MQSAGSMFTAPGRLGGRRSVAIWTKPGAQSGARRPPIPAETSRLATDAGCWRRLAINAATAGGRAWVLLIPAAAARNLANQSLMAWDYGS